MITHGGAFENFPYTNFHELNLDWLLNKVKEYIEKFLALESDFKELQDNFDELKAWVEQYIDEELKDAVNAKLDEWLEDGTLEDLINGKVYNELLHLIPDEDEEAAYKDNALRVMVNWLERNHGADYIASGSIINEAIPITVRYGAGKGYLGLYNHTWDFDKNIDEYVERDGYNCRVCFMDCTTFVSLIQRNIPWNRSPYYEMMVNNNEEDAYKAGLIPFIDMQGVKPYLTDAFGDITTWPEAFTLDMSGNHPLRIAKTTRTPATDDGVIEIDINYDLISRLETGDIIWVGDNTGSGDADKTMQYKCIHHDAIFVRSLEELNAYTDNVTFKLSDSVPGAHPEYGYVVHCTNETAGVYENGIRINTLYDLIVNLPAYTAARYPAGRDHAERGVYVTSGTISNTGADSRSDFYASNILRAGTKSYYKSGYEQGSTDRFGRTNLMGWYDSAKAQMELYSIGSKGMRLMPSSIDHENKIEIFDLNKYTVNGHYTNPASPAAGYTQEFRHFPTNNFQSVAFELYVTGFRRTDGVILHNCASDNALNGMQFIVGDLRQRIYARGTGATGVFQSWQTIAGKEFVASINYEEIPANSIVDRTFTWDEIYNWEGSDQQFKFYTTPQKAIARLRLQTSGLTAEQIVKAAVLIKTWNISGVTITYVNANDVPLSLGAQVIVGD